MVEAGIANIGPKERAKRLRAGIGYAVIGLAAAAALIATGVPRGYRLLVFLPFWGAGAGVFQYREKT